SINIMKKIIIAIDGPAGSGKTTTAKELAKRLGHIYIDTGAMYRTVTLACLRSGLALEESLICGLLEDIDVTMQLVDGEQKTFLNGEDVSRDIRLPEVTKHVSPISAIRCVREKMVDLQRKLGESRAVVVDGRDIGTTVFPSAELKIFLVASPEARAARRTLELQNSGVPADTDEIKEQIIARDKFDSTREISPLRKADDAIEIDTSSLTIEQQTELIYNLASKLISDNS
ncbi:MAG: (d)CMP kinase, partial [Bacteroidota bacterium]